MHGAAAPCILSLSKSLFDKLSNANRVAGFTFEKAALRSVFCPRYTPPDKTDSHFIRACGRELYEVFDALKMHGNRNDRLETI